MVSRRKRPKPMLYMEPEEEEGVDHQLDLLLSRSPICHIPTWLPCNFQVCRINNQCKCQYSIQLRFRRTKFNNNNNNNNNKPGIKTRVRFNREARTITNIPKKKSSLFL